jgi:hypothetical protein
MKKERRERVKEGGRERERERETMGVYCRKKRGRKNNISVLCL